MTTTPVALVSAVPIANVFRKTYVPGGTTGTKGFDGWAIPASLAAEARLDLAFNLPEPLPGTGSPNLRLWIAANATSGNLSALPKSASGTMPFDFSGTALTAEASAQTITWASGDADLIKEVDIPIAAITIGASHRYLSMALTFQVVASALAQIPVFRPFLIWK